MAEQNELPLAVNDNKPRRAKIGEARAFLNDVIARKDEITGCVFWPFYRDHKGYARITIDAQPGLAHRYVCKAVNGDPPPGRPQAAHNCGNGKHGCISPFCLRWATQVENEADKVIHGTKLTGEAAPWSKVTAETARMVHVLRAEGKTQEHIASSLNILRQQVGRIASGDRWNHVHPDNDPVTAEMVAAVRGQRPTQDCRINLFDDDVRRIHVMHSLGLSLSDIAREIGTDAKQVSRIVRMERRAHLHPDNDNITARMVEEATKAA